MTTGIIYQKECLKQEATRLIIYQILHAIYSYPVPETVNSIKDFLFLCQNKDFISHLEFDMKNTLDCIKDSLNKDTLEILEDLQVEYTRLFINSFKGVFAKPYESVYLDKTHLMIGNTTVEVRDFYEEFGICVSDGHPEPPDHIAIETEFMVHLITEEMEAYKKGEIEKGNWFRSGQNRFLKQHLLGWVHDFSNLVCQHTQHPFYLNAGLFTKYFFDYEKRGISPSP